MPPHITLRARVEPAVWPADALTDVRFHLVLENEGDKKTAIYPGAAKLSDMISMAGAGISWQLRFRGPDGSVHQQELREWHGPPGEPPSASGVKKSTEEWLAPGAKFEAVLGACFVPNARLAREHLDPSVLDPKRMDGIADFDPERKWPPGYSPPVPLHRRMPLSQSSVLVYGEAAAHLEREMVTRPDFLRGRFSSVVAFFVSPGEYQLDAAYLQQSWMDIGEKFTVQAAPTSIRLAAP